MPIFSGPSKRDDQDSSNEKISEQATNKASKFTLVNKRPEANIQLKNQEKINNSPLIARQSAIQKRANQFVEKQGFSTSASKIQNKGIVQGVFRKLYSAQKSPSPFSMDIPLPSPIQFIDEDTKYIYVYRSKTSNGKGIIVEREDGFQLILIPIKGGAFRPIDLNEDRKELRLNMMHVPETSSYSVYDNKKKRRREVEKESSDEKSHDATSFFEPSNRLPGRIAKKPKRGNTKKKVGPSLVTNLTSQVVLSPLYQGNKYKNSEGMLDLRYKPHMVLVEQIRLGDLDRPDTRFGTEQKSHTVAWTLLRAALTSKVGIPAAVLLKYLSNAFHSLTEIEQKKEAKLLIQAGTRALSNLKSAILPINIWQSLLSNLITTYIQAYQASSAATFSKGRATGKGEATKMANLRQADKELREKYVTTVDNKKLIKDAAGLLDVALNRSLGAKGFAFAVHHWAESLMSAFPRLMMVHGIAIIKNVFDAPISGKTVKKLKVSTWGELVKHFGLSNNPKDFIPRFENPYQTLGTAFGKVPDKLDVDFVANAEVNIGEHAGTSMISVRGTSRKVGVYLYDSSNVMIRKVNISDKDRPKTKFTKRQASHTAAWTLVRHDIMAFAGQSANKLLSVLSRRLSRYIKDITRSSYRRLAQDTFIRVESLFALKAPIHIWQARLSEVIRQYTIVSQLIDSATHSDSSALGRAEGHGEAKHMKRLRRVEFLLKSGEKPDSSEKEITHAARQLLDIRIGKTLSALQFVRAIFHWEELMHSAFPFIMKNIGTAIKKGLLDQKLSKENAKGEGVKTIRQLVEKYKGRATESAVKKSAKKPGDPIALLNELGFTRHKMDGTGNDCALNTIYDQLTRQGLDLGNKYFFIAYLRLYARLAYGSMVDILNNGARLLETVNKYLIQKGQGEQHLIIDVWSATHEGGLMNYYNVAKAGRGTRRIMTFYFNGINHFDSLTGGPPRT